MALIRGHHAFDDHFTQIPNDWVRDDRLSLEARGLLAQIMSHRPGWNLSIKSMAKRNHIGRDKVKRILDELLKHGYLERSEHQRHDERGHLAGYDYTTRDPQGVTQEPCKVEPDKAEPDKDAGPPKNTIPKKNKSKNNINIELAFSQFWDVYPRKEAKAKAREAFQKAVEKYDLNVIMAGAVSYRNDPNREPAFTAHATTWLNQQRWEDDPLPSNRKKTANEHNMELLRKIQADGLAKAENERKMIDTPDFGAILRRIDD